MLNKRTFATMTLGLAVALSLSACGNRLPVNAPVDTSSDTDVENPVVDPGYEQPVVTTPTVPTTPAYQQPLTGSLVVSGMDKKKTGGVLGMAKKIQVSGQVINTSNVALSGTVKVKFLKKKGVINKSMEEIGVKEQVIAQLAPGQSISFSLTSDKHCDDAEVTVETTQPTAAAGMTAASNPYGAPAPAYGAPTGYPQSTYPQNAYGY